MKLPRCKCKQCGKEFAARTANGDWISGAIYPRAHRLGKTKPYCEGTYFETEILPDKKP